VFHGRLGKLPLLKELRKLHNLHHAHAYDEKRNKYFEPLWFKIAFFSFLFLFGSFVNLAFTLGLLSFGLLYAYRHKRIHNEDETSYFSKHHYYHHGVDLRTNYSGVYPVIDYIFGTSATQKRK
jgi:sterol desaturase/sphingolipid hydroxylase (fatty acid hydroxylase superfamily)